MSDADGKGSLKERFWFWHDVFDSQDEVGRLLTGQRLFLINFCAPIFGVAALILLITYLALDLPVQALSLTLSIACPIVLLSAPYLFRKTQSFNLVGGLLTASIGATLYVNAWTTDGIQSASLIVFVQLPLLATFFAGIRAGMITVLAVVIATIVLALQTATEPGIPSEQLGYAVMICLFGITSSAAVYLVVGAFWRVVVSTIRSLGQAKHELERSNNAKTAFLAQMSHEFRTPLNGIMGMSELIMLGPGENPKEKEYARHINDSGVHLLALVNEILDFSAMMSSDIKLNLEEVFASSLFRFVSNAVDSLAKERKQTIHFPETLETELPIIADETKIRQVMLNLVSNAIKYSPEGTSITVSMQVLDNRMVEIAVSDEGMGLTPSEIELALEPFGRIEGATNPQAQGDKEGIGLGLPICKRIIEAHGGTLAIESKKGVGTIVKLLLPHPSDT